MTPRTATRLRWLATVLVPVGFGLATIVLQRAGGITLFDDEMGFLGEAVWFSTRSGTPVLAGSPFYSAGYPALLALPMSVLPFDPWVVAVGVNVALLGVLGAALHRLLLDLDLDRAGRLTPRGVAIAAIAGACVPSTVLQAPRAWPEVAFAAGVAAWAVLLLRFERRGSLGGAVAVGVVAAGLFSLHRRALAIVALTVLAIVVRSVWSAFRERDRTRVAWAPMAAGVVATGLGMVGALRLDALVTDELYRGTTSGSRLDAAENLLSTDWIPVAVGQAWAALVTTAGLAGFGLFVAVALMRGRRHVLWAGTVVLATGGVLMTSVLFLAEGLRADHHVYERYLAPLLPVLAAIAVAGLVARTVRVGPAAGAVAGAVAIGTVVLRFGLDDELRGAVQKFTIPTLVGMDVPSVGWAASFAPGIHVVPIAALAVAVGAVVVGAIRARPVGAVTVLVAWGGLVALSSAGALRPFADQWEPVGRFEAELIEASGGETLQLAPGIRNDARNVVHYRLGYPPVVVIDPDRCPDEPLFLGPLVLDSRRDIVRSTEIPLFASALWFANCG